MATRSRPPQSSPMSSTRRNVQRLAAAALPVGFRGGGLEVSRLPFVERDDINQLDKVAKDAGFQKQPDPYGIKDSYIHPDGSWIAMTLRSVERGYEDETFRFVPTKLESLPVLPVGQDYAAQAFPPKSTSTLRADLQSKGFVETYPNLFIHADQSWVAVFHDGTVVRGVGEQQLDPTDFPAPPRPSKPASDTASKTSPTTLAAGTPIANDGGSPLVKATAPATKEDVELMEAVVAALHPRMRAELSAAGYTINVSRHSVTNADPTLRGRAIPSPAATLIDHAEGLHRSGGRGGPWIGVRTYRKDGGLRLDVSTVLHEIGHAYDLLIGADTNGALHIQKPFADAFQAEHKRLPPYFHTQEEFAAETFAIYMLDPERCQRQFPLAFAALDAVHGSRLPDGKALAGITAKQRPKAVVNLAPGEDPMKRLTFLENANRARSEAGIPTQPYIFTLSGKLDFGAPVLVRELGELLRTTRQPGVGAYRPDECVVELKAAHFSSASEMQKVLDEIAQSGRATLLYVEDLASVATSSPGLAVLERHLDINGAQTPLVFAGEPTALSATDGVFPKIVRYPYAIDPLSAKDQAAVVMRYAADENFTVTSTVEKALAQRARGGGYEQTNELWQALKKAQVGRVSSSSSTDVSTVSRITKPDVDAMAMKAVKDPAAEMERLIGQEGAKHQVKAIVGTLKVAALRAQHGMPVGQRPRLNLLFAGPPGTGKTTVAELFTEMLMQVGYLKNPTMKKVTIQDILSGSPEQSIKRLFEENKGGVIFVDELHQLADTPEGKRAFRAMIPYLASSEYADTVFIGAGYSDELTELIRNVDAGGERRFTTVPFDTFSQDQLGSILDSMAADRHIVMDSAARAAALAFVDHRKRITKNFGNAGEVGNALDEAAKRQVSRLSDADPTKITKKDLESFTPEDFAIPARITTEEVWKEINALEGLDDVKAELERLATLIDYGKTKGKAPHEVVEPYFIIDGPPGAGKTTLARLLARFGAAYGLIAQGDVVERQGASIQGRFVGQTSGDVAKVFEGAWGRLLFLDEVSGLAKAGGTFKDEAATVILKQMEDYRGKFMMVVADYPENVNMFLDLNAGLPRRFGTRFTLPEWKPEQAARALATKLAEDGADASVIGDRLVEGFAELAKLPGWSNGGDVRTMRQLVEKHIASAASKAGADVDTDSLLPKAFEAALADLSRQKEALAARAPARKDDGSAYDVAVEVKSAAVDEKAEAELFSDADRTLLAAFEAVDQQFAAHFDAAGPDALMKAQADPKSDYMKAVAEKLGVDAKEAVEQAEQVRVKIRQLVETEEVVQRFQYHCPYCGGIDSGSCAYITMPMEWKVQHSLKKPWTETTRKTEVVETEL